MSKFQDEIKINYLAKSKFSFVARMVEKLQVFVEVCYKNQDPFSEPKIIDRRPETQRSICRKDLNTQI